MKINFKVSTSSEYFEQTNRDIDWYKTDKNKVSISQAELIQKILSLQISIFVLRNSRGIDDSCWESLVELRRDFIKKYEQVYEKYILYEDFY